eukprot:TRINITY_DN13342_c0_g1_i1.p1 TRINITY_DN13342_c0_g1~~TRINITY_DN13342_c0_g1_i1.p1  ORF type:complete len:185 (-),score=53.17 TRINITY_DN13342_c0_g1_i1:144-698(-)
MPKGLKKVKASRGKVVVRQGRKQKPIVNLSQYNFEKKWDKQRTIRQNFQALGLSINPNQTIPVVAPGLVVVEREQRKDIQFQQKVDDDPLVKSEDMTDLVNQLEVPAKKERPEPWLTDNEMICMRDLVKRYGDNHKKMSRDLKLNPFQLTKKILKKKSIMYHQQVKKKQEKEKQEEEQQEEAEE